MTFKSKNNFNEVAAGLLLTCGALLGLFGYIQSALSLAIGVGIGLVLGNPNPTLTKKISQWSLQIAIVALAAGMNINNVVRAGVSGLALAAMTITFVMLLGVWLGRLLNSNKEISLFTTIGTAICGGSAIAAASAALKPKSETVTVSLAIVFILNAIALVLFPPIGNALGLTQAEFGVWAALAIHDTSSVVGASAQYGNEALQLATTIKLSRAIWIMPLVLVVAKIQKTKLDSKTGIPLFIFGFIICSILFTYIEGLQPYGQSVYTFGRRILVVALLFIGAGLTRKSLKAVGIKPLLHGVTLWFLVILVSLILAKLNLVSF